MNPDLGKPTTKEYNAWLNTKLKHRQVSYVLKICNKLTADRKKTNVIEINGEKLRPSFVHIDR